MNPRSGTRADGLDILSRFQPRMGRRYAAGRNYDKGPGAHEAVSCLSPYIRRRLVTEAETVAAALDTHGPEASEKFVQEVFWRSYFKGWLERRPSIWESYVAGLDQDRQVLSEDRKLRKRVEAAEAGATGLACFDAWAEELLETGYMHNHARMWFASIWIFTFGLPWRLGADFFFRNLLDGDPASNTLSWRWVAGLHTRGKVYEARAWNIAKFTHQRHQPRESDFAAEATALDHLEHEGLPKPQPLRSATPPDREAPTALLLTEEDCLLDPFDPLNLDIRAIGALPATRLRSNAEISDIVLRFEQEALADTSARLGREAEALMAGDPKDLARWAAKAGARQIATPYVTVGPLRDWLDRAAPHLAAEGVALCEWRRSWDEKVWPHATAGFFKVKAQIPRILSDMGMDFG